MKINLYFVRHAHSVYSTDELGRPLSEKGLLDACRVTALLKQERIDRVLSSPYQRAVQTVAGVAEEIGSEIELVEEFKERTLSEGPLGDFASAIRKVWEDEHFFWEGGESNVQAQKRGVAKTLEVLQTYQGQNIVIGTHGNIMVLIMNHFDPSFDFQFWKELAMPAIYQLSFNGTNLENVKRIGNF
ncbi:histidine phosphatase family protein [Planococcus sp. YIM B11945]|uniref:histidine phosphatase family protein n=1 Tax=Planococcus sp. YIM B11945 TaxID=3435410 RepID=UPI003D7E7A7D